MTCAFAIFSQALPAATVPAGAGSIAAAFTDALRAAESTVADLPAQGEAATPVVSSQPDVPRHFGAIEPTEPVPPRTVLPQAATAIVARPAVSKRGISRRIDEINAQRQPVEACEDERLDALPLTFPFVPVQPEAPRRFGFFEPATPVPVEGIAESAPTLRDRTVSDSPSRQDVEPTRARETELPVAPAIAMRIARRTPSAPAIPHRIAPLRLSEESAERVAPARSLAYDAVAAFADPRHDHSPAPVAVPRRSADAPVGAVERVLPPDPPIRPEPLRDLSIEIRHADNDRVEVRLLQRSGELHVAVRATDTELAQAMRQSLPELAGNLEQEGHRVEAWRPGGLVSPATAGAEAQPSGSDQAPADPQSQGRWTQPESDQHRRHRQDAPRWVEDLESALSEDTGESNGFSR